MRSVELGHRPITGPASGPVCIKHQQCSERPFPSAPAGFQAHYRPPVAPTSHAHQRDGPGPQRCRTPHLEIEWSSELRVRGLVLFMNKAADVSGTSWTPHAHSHRKSPIVVTSVMVWHVSLRSAISLSMLLTSCSWSPSSFLQEHLSVPPPHGGQTEFCMMYIRKVAPTELARCMRSCVCPVRLTQPWI